MPGGLTRVEIWLVSGLGADLRPSLHHTSAKEFVRTLNVVSLPIGPAHQQAQIPGNLRHFPIAELKPQIPSHAPDNHVIGKTTVVEERIAAILGAPPYSASHPPINSLMQQSQIDQMKSHKKSARLQDSPLPVRANWRRGSGAVRQAIHRIVRAVYSPEI